MVFSFQEMQLMDSKTQEIVDLGLQFLNDNKFEAAIHYFEGALVSGFIRHFVFIYSSIYKSSF